MERSPCRGCERERRDKNDRRCVKCEKRLALMDDHNYIALATGRHDQPCAVHPAIGGTTALCESWDDL